MRAFQRRQRFVVVVHNNSSNNNNVSPWAPVVLERGKTETKRRRKSLFSRVVFLTTTTTSKIVTSKARRSLFPPMLLSLCSRAALIQSLAHVRPVSDSNWKWTDLTSLLLNKNTLHQLPKHHQRALLFGVFFLTTKNACALLNLYLRSAIKNCKCGKNLCPFRKKCIFSILFIFTCLHQ